MNQSVMVGRIGRVDELKPTRGGSLLKFSVACDRRAKVDGQWDKVTEWFDCQLWGKRADALANVLEQGMAVTVVAERQTSEWEGKKRYSYDVREVSIQGRKHGGGAPRDTQPRAHDPAPFDDDEMPF